MLQNVSKIGMRKKILISAVILWCLIEVIGYYLPYFIVALLWIGLILSLLTITTIQIIKTVRERKSISRLRLLNVLTFFTLLFFTYNDWIFHQAIEKIDWKIFYNKRMKIVQEIKNKKLYQNFNSEDTIYKLPFEFPIVSNGGNDIIIYRSNDSSSVTVLFWVYRNFFSSPSTYFVYTNDPNRIMAIERSIARNPQNNWKLNTNWYRMMPIDTDIH